MFPSVFLCNFAHYFVNDEGIYPKIENYIDILINFCINIEPENKLEEGLGLMNEILSNCKKLPNHIIKFFIPLINLIIEEKDIDLYGNENLSTIAQLLCFYISKDSNDVLINFILLIHYYVLYHLLLLFYQYQIKLFFVFVYQLNLLLYLKLIY